MLLWRRALRERRGEQAAVLTLCGTAAHQPLPGASVRHNARARAL